MRKTESSVSLKTIENLQEIVVDESITTVVQDKIRYRRERINKLRLRGYTNQQISQKTGFNLSTIEKDLKAIRENCRDWYKSELIIDYCQSIQDAIILYDCGVEELQLLYNEEDNGKIKFYVWSKILELSEKKIQLLEKTRSVKDYLRFNCKLIDENLEADSI